MTDYRVGVISDTHGLLRKEAIRELRGCDHIIHAGDVGKPEILEQLKEIAPLTAVCGNVDSGAWAGVLPLTAVAQVGEASFCVIHNIHDLVIDPAAAGMQAVIYGHSHHATQEWKQGVFYFNPGSAGPLRFGLPATMGILRLTGGLIEVDFITLAGG